MTTIRTHRRVLGLAAVVLLAACRFDGVPTAASTALQFAAPEPFRAPAALPVGRDMKATLRAWADYCAREGGACDAAPARIQATPDLWALLDAVQRRVNAAHPYSAEPLGADAWRTLSPGEPGDCEDLALTKRAHLIRAGLAPGALRPATCRLRGSPFAPGDGHAVLTVETTAGTYVLGASGDAVPWDGSECDSWGYRWAGSTWVALRD